MAVDGTGGGSGGGGHDYNLTITDTVGVQDIYSFIYDALLTFLPQHVPGNWCHWPEGQVFVSDGLNPVYKWDGLKTFFQKVGLDQPTGTPTIGSSGTGTISGIYTAYVRFLDSDGRPSPLSNPATEVTVTDVLQIDYSTLPISTDPRAVTRQILRNTNGQENDFYVDIETDDLTATNLSSANTDDDLQGLEKVTLFDSDGTYLQANEPPRTDKPILVAHRQRIFAGGEVVYRRGNAIVTNGSTTVYGIGTNWTASMADRDFFAIGEIKRYTIDSVDETNQTITLATAYGGASDSFCQYLIRTPQALRTNVYYSNLGNPDGWDETNQTMQVAEVGDQVTALIPFQSFMYISFRDQTYQLTFNSEPRIDGDIHLIWDRGCLNQRCWCKVSGQLYLMDHLGIYTFADGVHELAGPIHDLFTLQVPGDVKIDWSQSEFFHAVEDNENSVLRFFVSLSGPGLPRHALCYHILSEQWWIEKYPVPITASHNWHTTRDRLLLAAPGYTVLEHGQGRLDVLNGDGMVTRAAVTDADLFSVTAPDLILPASGLSFAPIAVVEGKGKNQVCLLETYDSATGKITTDRPWLDIPDDTSIIQVGAIEIEWRGGWQETLGLGQANVEMLWEPTTNPATIGIKFFLDHSNDPEEFTFDVPVGATDVASWSKGDTEMIVTLTAEIDEEGKKRFTGYLNQTIRQIRDSLEQTGRYTSIEIAGFAGVDGVRIYTIRLGGSLQ